MLSRRGLLLCGIAGATGAPRAARAWIPRGVGGGNPWPSDATVVHNASELFNAVRNGPDGTHYLCAPGDYGAFDPGFQPRATRPDGSAPVHVWGQAGVTFTSINVGQGKFIHFHYITANGSADYAFSVSSSVDIAFDHCLATNAASAGFSIGNTVNPSVTWCKADTVGVGVAFVSCTNVVLSDTWVTNFSADAFDVFGCTTVTVNRTLSSTPAPDAGHPDSFQLSSYGGVRGTDYTLRDINFDRNGGTQANGPCFTDHCDRVNATNVASFGSNTNGVSFSDMTDSHMTNALLQGYDFATLGVIRGASTNCSMTNVQTTAGCSEYAPEAGTGNTFSGCTLITQATDVNDRAVYLAFLAANPTIPTAAHWASAGYI